MRSIVTGATGFIGYALVEELLRSGGTVTVVLRPESGRKERLLQLAEEYRDKLTLLELPLEAISELATVHGVQADVFYHLAWNGSGGADRNDFAIQYSNIGYTAGALKAAAACGCKRFVGAGSQAEYGVIRETAYEDRTVPHPFMMYGAAKTAAYQTGQVLAKQLGIELVWPRIYSVYGVGENAGTLVNYVIDSLSKGEIPQLSPCENMWNFMYITDCVRALRLLGETPNVTGIYHVASEDTRPLREFVEEIRDIVAPGAELGFGEKESAPNTTFQLMPNTDKLKALGFSCEVAFEEGVGRKVGRRI